MKIQTKNNEQVILKINTSALVSPITWSPLLETSEIQKLNVVLNSNTAENFRSTLCSEYKLCHLMLNKITEYEHAVIYT